MVGKSLQGGLDEFWVLQGWQQDLVAVKVLQVGVVILIRFVPLAGQVVKLCEVVVQVFGMRGAEFAEGAPRKQG